MGEIIKNLHSIKIGSETLMIELNEGYFKDQGRLIHIQNPHFRYQISEKDFLIMSSEILRSRREMEYVKSDTYIKKITPKHAVYTDATEKTQIAEKEIASLLKSKGIDYRLISDGENFFTLLINPKCKDDFLALICDKKRNIVEIDHPYTEKAGYIYLYQMDPFKLYTYEDIYMEVYFQLPCRSLTDKTWIPLDKTIQKYIWNNLTCNEDGLLLLDTFDKIIFYITWSVFNTHCFSDISKSYIDSNIEFTYKPVFSTLLKSVFFNYSDQLICMLQSGEYDSIIEHYYKYKLY